MRWTGKYPSGIEEAQERQIKQQQMQEIESRRKALSMVAQFNNNPDKFSKEEQIQIFSLADKYNVDASRGRIDSGQEDELTAMQKFGFGAVGFADEFLTQGLISNKWMAKVGKFEGNEAAMKAIRTGEWAGLGASMLTPFNIFNLGGKAFKAVTKGGRLAKIGSKNISAANKLAKAASKKVTGSAAHILTRAGGKGKALKFGEDALKEGSSLLKNAGVKKAMSGVKKSSKEVIEEATKLLKKSKVVDPKSILTKAGTVRKGYEKTVEQAVKNIQKKTVKKFITSSNKALKKSSTTLKKLEKELADEGATKFVTKYNTKYAKDASIGVANLKSEAKALTTSEDILKKWGKIATRKPSKFKKYFDQTTLGGVYKGGTGAANYLIARFPKQSPLINNLIRLGLPPAKIYKYLQSTSGKTAYEEYQSQRRRSMLVPPMPGLPQQ